MSNNTEPRVGSPSPWGRIDNISTVAPGILFVGTESHGGVWLSDERIAQIPEALRTRINSGYCPKPVWWEEDCEAGFPLWFFGAHYDRELHHRPDRDMLLKMLDYFGPAWIKALKELKVTPVCSHCRSADVTCDACARWDDEAQEFTLSATYDNTDCGECDGECHTFLVPSIALRPEPAEEPRLDSPSEHRLRLMESGL